MYGRDTPHTSDNPLRIAHDSLASPGGSVISDAICTLPSMLTILFYNLPNVPDCSV